MSTAGIHSNRGDVYQTLVAFDWALTILLDRSYQWLEVDSVLYPVDDVVIGKVDGSVVCCQCKKNQPTHTAWTIGDLSSELEKASHLLADNPKATARFYSRSPFGAVSNLREHSVTQADEESYHTSLGAAKQKADADLAACLGSRISTYEFLQRTEFEVSPTLDRMKELLQERLHSAANNSTTAFDALYVLIDQLGSRLEGNGISTPSQHRLSKEDLQLVLQRAGALLAPIMDITKVRDSFASTSAIGRSWHRDISGERISNPTVSELLEAIDDGKRSILLTGQPGSGKTCVMLDLQEALEQRAHNRSDIAPLFIQSREFADFATAQERQALGLPEQWVEQAVRMAETVRVVVVIDSLDVLSIAREHTVLQYFLAQIDRLLLIPNITVVTACRNFDRRYDRHIAKRKWDCELECQHLDWDNQVAPLLSKLGIDATAIDAITRELIRNPRELSLFVELAQSQGAFNVVTSQALAQRYLDSVISADPNLGDAAMQAIEKIANEMLRSRSLSIPSQRLGISQEIVRSLLSLNILQETHERHLTFGHQTLLDVLVISGAIRSGISLNEFIQSLPPVPFVRPSIRSFVAQLATGSRREFRKQMRAVLTGDAAFHIRRLVAESLAEQLPQEEDWPLIRDLRVSHRDVFQVIYHQARLIEWHYFWMGHLVPILKDERDEEGLITHVFRVGQWINDDTSGVVALCREALSLEWLDKNRIANQVGFRLGDVKAENLALIVPLIEPLFVMSDPERTQLGKAIARCVDAGVADDYLLWRYITGNISDDDVLSYHFGNKLNSEPHKFGGQNDDFLTRRMIASTTLLDLAIEAIGHWSQMRESHYGEPRLGYLSEFLDETSYQDTHSQQDFRHGSNERYLMDAIENAILRHAEAHSEWWVANRERICFNQEGAICYFGVLACTKFPETNVELIGRMLCDQKLLEFRLIYELGTLIRAAFVYLNEETQDAVLETIQSIWQEERETDEHHSLWVMKKKVEYITAIPCHMRPSESQALVDFLEKTDGPFIRCPTIGMRGGMVSPPFSFEEFITATDGGVLKLLGHYSGYETDYEDFLSGGEREVGMQLHEAASRQPLRFLGILTSHWSDIPEAFRDHIMAGVANYLQFSYGNLRSNSPWEPNEEPNAHDLAGLILDELERHSGYWQYNRSTSQALEGCSHVIQDTDSAARLASLAVGFSILREESSISGDSVDLITTGINMITGKATEALMILANNLFEHEIPLPELLAPALKKFAQIEHPAIRALILRRLPFLQSKNSELGWDLFDLAMHDAAGLWRIAEPCLYYAFFDHMEMVSPLLERIYQEGEGKDFETWGRISALAAITSRGEFATLLDSLSTQNAAEAWSGAASVWTHPENFKQNREQCIAGIEAGLSSERAIALEVAQRMSNIHWGETTPPMPIELLSHWFAVLKSKDDGNRGHLFRFEEWLNAMSERDPDLSLTATELYLDYVKSSQQYFYDHDNNLMQTMTRLFAEAEEREESDGGAMLRRVVSIQDTLLSLGVDGINDWLKEAERQ